MKKELTLQQSHPFVRYARYMYLSHNGINYSESTGYDCRLFYVCKGYGKISADGKIYDLSPNDMIIFQSGVNYQLLTPDDSVTYLALNFDFSFDHCDKVIPIPPSSSKHFNRDALLECVHFTNFAPFNTVFYISNISSVKSDLEKTEYTYRRQKRFYELKASALLQNVFVKAARLSSLINEENHKNASDINEIIDYIHKNFNQKISNEHIGKIFNFHPNYVNSLMKNHTGHSLHGYVLSVRISKAIDLLETTDLKISVIANLVGFDEITHFSRYFKKITGKSPSYFKAGLDKNFVE